MPMHKVLVHPASYNNCREAVDRAFELFPISVTGKKILINPNVLRLSEAKEGIVTHPAVLKAVVEKVETLNPSSIVVGDNPGAMSYGANEESFSKSGLRDAAGGYYKNIGTESVEVRFNPTFVDKVSVSRDVLEADIIISLPKFKTHGLTTITGAIKNCYGFLPGAQKAKLHAVAGDPWRFGELVVDVFGLRIPDLFIMDAVVGMEGNGPASKDLRDIGKIIASDNAVALDATVGRMMTVDPASLRFLQVARKRGFGEYDASAIKIIGEFSELPKFKLPPILIKAEDITSEVKDLLHSRTVLRPTVDEDLCTGCETCTRQCPVSALELINGLPVVNDQKCITCFCCQEMCPESAIKLR